MRFLLDKTCEIQVVQNNTPRLIHRIASKHPSSSNASQTNTICKNVLADYTFTRDPRRILLNTLPPVYSLLTLKMTLVTPVPWAGEPPASPNHLHQNPSAVSYIKAVCYATILHLHPITSHHEHSFISSHLPATNDSFNRYRHVCL